MSADEKPTTPEMPLQEALSILADVHIRDLDRVDAMSDDVLWKAALMWWHSKVPKGGPTFTNLDHIRQPLLNCSTPEEEALALAVAAQLRLDWLCDSQAGER